MKLKVLLLLIASIFTVGAASAQTVPTPPPNYLTKAIFVRVWYDNSFVTKWAKSDVNSQIEGIFQAARAKYKDNNGLFKLQIFWLKDNDPADPTQNPFIGAKPYNDPEHFVLSGNENSGNRRLLKHMRDKFSTGAVTKRSGQTTHTLGRTVNVLFVHKSYGGQAGEVDTIGSLGGADANLFISTLKGGQALCPGCDRAASSDQDPEFLVATLAHELGHIVGGKHSPTAENCLAGQPDKELMCGGSAFPRYVFGRLNTPIVRTLLNTTLARCNNAFSSITTCERHVRNNLCLNISPGSAIDACQQNQIVQLCHTDRFCTQGDSQVQIHLRALPTIINGAP